MSRTTLRGELKKAGKGLLKEFNRQLFGGSKSKKKKKYPRLTIAYYHGEPHTLIQKGEIYKVKKVRKR